jgi:hypothetical protein
MCPSQLDSRLLSPPTSQLIGSPPWVRFSNVQGISMDRTGVDASKSWILPNVVRVEN